MHCSSLAVVDHAKLEEAVLDPEWRTAGAAACVCGLVLAMKELHSRNLVHGDLKVENVMIHTNLKSVTLGDLGLGKLKCSSFNGYGTVGFQAPETNGHFDQPSRSSNL